MTIAGIKERSFYAFVESIERLAPDLRQQSQSPAIAALLQTRRSSGLPEPTHVVWLDCIDQEFFDDLPWKGVKIQINAPVEGERRRRELQDIPSEQLRVILLLLESRDQDGVLGEFRNTAWHRVLVGNDHGAASAVGTDFEASIEGPFQIQFMRHEESYHGDALQPFINVFNVDFIEDMKFEEDSSGGTFSMLPPTAPAAPSGAAVARNHAIDRSEALNTESEENDDQSGLQSMEG